MNMKKIASIGCGLVALASAVIAGELQMTDVGSYSGYRAGEGSAALEVVIAPQNGILYNDAFVLSVSTNALVTTYRPHIKSTAADAVSATTQIWVYATAGSNDFGGFSLTTSDYLLVDNSTGNTGTWQLTQINEVSTYSNATKRTLYELETAVSVAKGDQVYIIDVDNNLTFPGDASADQTGLHSIWSGKRNQPVLFSVPTTAGTVTLSGTYKVLD